MAQTNFVGIVNGVEYTDPQAYGIALGKAIQAGKPVDATVRLTPVVDHIDQTLELKRPGTKFPEGDKLVDPVPGTLGINRCERSKTSLNKEVKAMIKEHDMIPMFNLDDLTGDEEHDSDVIDAFLPRLSQQHIGEILEQVRPWRVDTGVRSLYDDKLAKAFQFAKGCLELNGKAKSQAHLEKAKLQEQETQLNDQIEELTNQLHQVQDAIAHQKAVLHVCYDAENILKHEMEAYKAIHDGMANQGCNVTGRVKERDKAYRPEEEERIQVNARQVRPQAALDLSGLEGTGFYRLLRELGLVQ